MFMERGRYIRGMNVLEYFLSNECISYNCTKGPFTPCRQAKQTRNGASAMDDSKIIGYLVFLGGPALLGLIVAIIKLFFKSLFGIKHSLIGKPCPIDHFSTYDGGTFSIDQFKGKIVVIRVFGANWDDYLDFRRKFAHLYEDERVTNIIVSAGNPSQTQIASYEKYKQDYPFLPDLLLFDSKGKLDSLFGEDLCLGALILDAAGIVQHVPGSCWTDNHYKTLASLIRQNHSTDSENSEEAHTRSSTAQQQRIEQALKLPSSEVEHRKRVRKIGIGMLSVAFVWTLLLSGILSVWFRSPISSQIAEIPGSRSIALFCRDSASEPLVIISLILSIVALIICITLLLKRARTHGAATAAGACLVFSLFFFGIQALGPSHIAAAVVTDDSIVIFTQFMRKRVDIPRDCRAKVESRYYAAEPDRRPAHRGFSIQLGSYQTYFYGEHEKQEYSELWRLAKALGLSHELPPPS